MKTHARGLTVVENTIDIRSSREDVFDYCLDLTHEPEWDPKAKRVEKVSSGPIGLGTRYEAEFLKGNPTTIEFVRFERPAAWDSVGRSRRLDARSEGRVSALEDGARLLMRMELRPKGTLRLLLPILGRWHVRSHRRSRAPGDALRLHPNRRRPEGGLRQVAPLARPQPLADTTAICKSRRSGRAVLVGCQGAAESALRSARAHAPSCAAA
jgi:hypothetical protein